MNQWIITRWTLNDIHQFYYHLHPIQVDTIILGSPCFGQAGIFVDGLTRSVASSAVT